MMSNVAGRRGSWCEPTVNAAGARYGNALLWAVLPTSVVAILFQAFPARALHAAAIVGTALVLMLNVILPTKTFRALNPGRACR
jgi:hypothetical protein